MPFSYIKASPPHIISTLVTHYYTALNIGTDVEWGARRKTIINIKTSNPMCVKTCRLLKTCSARLQMTQLPRHSFRCFCYFSSSCLAWVTPTVCFTTQKGLPLPRPWYLNSRGKKMMPSLVTPAQKQSWDFPRYQPRAPINTRLGRPWRTLPPQEPGPSTVKRRGKKSHEDMPSPLRGK